MNDNLNCPNCNVSIKPNCYAKCPHCNRYYYIEYKDGEVKNIRNWDEEFYRLNPMYTAGCWQTVI